MVIKFQIHVGEDGQLFFFSCEGDSHLSVFSIWRDGHLSIFLFGKIWSPIFVSIWEGMITYLLSIWEGMAIYLFFIWEGLFIYSCFYLGGDNQLSISSIWRGWSPIYFSI